MLIPLLLAAPQVATPAPTALVAELDRSEVPGQIVVSHEGRQAPDSIEELVATWDLESLAPELSLDGARKVLQWQRRRSVDTTTLVLLELSPASADLAPLMAKLRGVAGVQWVAPNVAMAGDPRELVPNDPLYGSQYHHPLMSNDDAWNVTLGDASVIMGITDDGVDLDHEDLAPNMWVNAGEIPGDGVDNDGNGYVDDVNGYDFVFGNGNANPNGSDDHGTHVAGIAGARTDNGIGVSGTAGRSTIMAIQFYASGQAWTAVNIADAFAYGIDNGARIISTSYNMDGWVGDPIVNAAYDYIHDNDSLHFNSAGNGNQLNPPRQAFQQSMLVISTDAADQRSSFSNYGTGCDLCAPGSSIFATTVNDTYGTKSGTSMAAPNAAGVAALIWSAHPGWTRDQVACQIRATCDDIDGNNPGFEGLLASGRVNSFRGVTETLPAPRVTEATGLPSEGGALVGDLTSFSLRTSQLLDLDSINVGGGLSLRAAGPDDVFGTGDDVPVALVVDEYLVGSNAVTASVAGALPVAGRYRVELDAAIVSNPFGTALDGNGDGVGGDSWTRTFSACGVVVVENDPAESGAGWSVVNVALTDGQWDLPPGVPAGGGVRSDPPTDFDGSGRCFLTDNVAGNSDVDGGPTRLISRPFDVSGVVDPYISFAAWLGTTGADPMDFDISDDGGATWVPMQTINGTEGWEVFTYRVNDFVSSAGSVRLRFSVADVGSGSVTEAGIDAIRVLRIDCGPGPIGTGYCTTSPNSVGAGATLSATGSARILDNDVLLEATGLPPGQFGIFFTGDTQAFGPLGNGFLCIGAQSITRFLPAAAIGAGGDTSLMLDLSAPPMVSLAAPGGTSNFQFWYRDNIGQGSNLTDALSITWQ